MATTCNAAAWPRCAIRRTVNAAAWTCRGDIHCRELNFDFELIDDAFKALLQSHPDPMTADKVADLRNKFRDAFTGWLQIEEAALVARRIAVDNRQAAGPNTPNGTPVSFDVRFGGNADIGLTL